MRLQKFTEPKTIEEYMKNLNKIRASADTRIAKIQTEIMKDIGHHLVAGQNIQEYQYAGKLLELKGYLNDLEAEMEIQYYHAINLTNDETLQKKLQMDLGLAEDTLEKDIKKIVELKRCLTALRNARL